MPFYPATSAELDIVGALFVEPIPGGVRPHRLPEREMERIPSAFMKLMVDFPAGVRVCFSTTATELTLRLLVHPLEMPPVSPVASALVDLVVNGEVVASKSVTGGAAQLDIAADTVVVQPSEAASITFEGLASGEKTVELWLPHTATVDFFGIDANAPLRRPEISHAPIWLHHGSSISHCLEATRPTRTWPAVASRMLSLDLLDLAYAGNALLDPFVARAIRDTPADLITLKLGINLVNIDSMRIRAFVPAVHGFLDTIREGHPDTPIVVISPIICPSVETLPGPTLMDPDVGTFVSMASDPDAADALTLERIRAILSDVVVERAHVDPNISYLDGLELFDNDDVALGMLPDGLHPNEAGYLLMAQRFAARLPELVRGFQAFST